MKVGFITAAIIAVLLCSISFGYSGGDGSAGNPYQIADVNDLLELAADTGNYDKCFILIEDIDLGSRVFSSAIIAPGSIDNETGAFLGVAFTGRFDGNDHAIYNLTITDLTKDFISLFGHVGSGGQILDLGVENTAIQGRGYVGGLVGWNNCGTIKSCYATGSVNGYYSVGGLVGYHLGALNSCYVTESVVGSYCVGGLVGNSEGSIDQCYSTGTVSGNAQSGGLIGINSSGVASNCYSTSAVHGNSHVGGLVGYNGEGHVYQCYSSGQVSGNNYVGGLIGTEICGSNCNSFWDIETSGQTASAGGKPRTTSQMKDTANYIGWNTPTQIIWILDQGNNYPKLAWQNQPGIPLASQVLDDFVPGSGMTADPYRISTAEQLNFIGLFPAQWDKVFQLENNIDLSDIASVEINKIGFNLYFPFVGIFDGNNHKIMNLTISGGYAYQGLLGAVGSGGQIKNLGLENISISGSSGSMMIGGLAGYNHYGSISNCYLTGSIIGNTYIGGLIGVNNEGVVTNCYATCYVNGNGDGAFIGGLIGENTGIVNNCYTIGNVIGDTNIGGLIGFSYRMGSMVSNCYSASTVSGTNGVGGLLGRQSGGIVVNCFWDTDTSGQTHSPYGTGKTTAEMQTLSTFTLAGWDFTNIWAICEGTNYPRFLWQIPAGDWICPDGVSVEDLEYFVERWMMENCTSADNYCGGADMDISGSVNLADWAVFAEHWMEGILL